MNRGVLVLLLVVLPVLAGPVIAGTIDGLRVWPAPDNTRLVFDLDSPSDHSILVLKKPLRIVLDIENTSLNTDYAELDLSNSGVTRIRSAVRNKTDIRIVLDMSANMLPRSFVLTPNDQYGHRLVLDLERPILGEVIDIPRAEPIVSKSIAQISRQRRDIVVVIDAGHGGEDPGAIGPSKLREKDVVLAIAKEVYRHLTVIEGYQPILVRDGDYIVGLKQRRDLARKKNADLFISIHADAYAKASANGASVYALSNGGVVSAVAKYLADQENSADVIGGINGVSLEDKDEVLKSVLVDLSMTTTLQSSLSVGTIVLNEMGRFAKLHGNRKQIGQANFVVLRAPDVPSILIETGFISNPREERNLGSAAYRKKMGSAISTGIQTYFQRFPPQGSFVAAQQTFSQQPQTRKYTVAKGDTLSGIAGRHGIPLAKLISLNSLRTHAIRVGQVLIVPGVS